MSELTFEPYGIGGRSTGRHFSHRIMDDLIGETAATSPAIIEDAIHFVDHARSLERPPNGGAELINCTPWAYRDCYCWEGSSRVWMGDGTWKAISDVKPGDVVVGFCQYDKGPPKEHLLGKRGGSRYDTRLCLTRVIGTNKRIGELRQHLLSDGKMIECTENHRFWRGVKCGRKRDRNEYGEIRRLRSLRKVMEANCS